MLLELGMVLLGIGIGLTMPTVFPKLNEPMEKPNRPKPDTTRFEPATPEPRYICQNCGMVIETGHKHTREECKEYLNPKDGHKNPDHRAIKKISEFPAINDPKVRLPRYYDSLRPSSKEEVLNNTSKEK